MNTLLVSVKLHSHCTDKQREFAKPGYEGVSASLGIMWRLIHCLDEDILGLQAIRVLIDLFPQKNRVTVSVPMGKFWD